MKSGLGDIKEQWTERKLTCVFLKFLKQMGAQCETERVREGVKAKDFQWIKTMALTLSCLVFDLQNGDVVTTLT